MSARTKTEQQLKSERLAKRRQCLEIMERRDYLVMKSNDLIHGIRYKVKDGRGGKLSLQQHKIVAYLISMIKPEDDLVAPLVFNMRTFASVCGIRPDAGGSYYKSVKKSLTDLASHVVWLDSEKDEYMVHYISNARHIKGTAEFEVIVDPIMIRYLTHLSGNFSAYQSKRIYSFENMYSPPLFDLLKAEAFRGGVTFELKEFQDRLDVGNYNITNLRNKVLDPAIEEINKYGDIQVSYSLGKTGRKFTHIYFDITDLFKSRRSEHAAELEWRNNEVDEKFDQMTLFDMYALPGSDTHMA